MATSLALRWEIVNHLVEYVRRLELEQRTRKPYGFRFNIIVLRAILAAS